MHLRNLGLCLTPLLLANILQAVPVANPDTFIGSEDRALNVSAADGVLENDTGTGALSAIIESDVSNGALTLNADGSFTYVPDENFNGTDTFTYRTSESPGAQVFTIDQGASSATIDATLSTDFGADDDSATTQIQGTLEALVTPSEAPFSQIQVTDMSIAVSDAVELNFRFAFGLAGVDVEAKDLDAERITIEMVDPGPASAVDGGGGFSQLMNEVRAFGTIHPSGTGLAAGQVPEGPQQFDEGGFFIDLEGTVTQSGNTLTMNVPVLFEGVFDLEGNTVDLDLTGDIVATSPVQTAELSAPTTVTINVSAVNDAPTVANETYSTTAGTQLSVPVLLPGSGDVTLVDTGATWRYLDDGSDQGSVWTAPDFDDSAWAAGPGQLGYGDSEATEVGFGGDANNKHVTTYFRHQFNVPDPEAHGTLTLRLKRDDGAAVFLNGEEIVRSNLPADATATTLASTTVDATSESHYFEFPLPTSLLVAGTNTLAAEIHQGAAASSDLIFDLQLIRSGTTGGVLANDSDTDGDTLSATVHSQPAMGNVALAPDGSFTYTPNAGFAGTDSFVYEVQDIDDFVLRELIPPGDSWKYLDDGSDQGTAWRDPGFNDSSWASGAGELGYGENDQATTLGFGPDENNKFATTYFRNHFFLGNVAALSDDVAITMVRDDAAAVYVNGTEIYRDSNLAIGAAFNAYATSGVAEEDEPVSISVPLATLVNGRNTIAVEVHQSSGTSSDLAFELSIICESPDEGSILPLGSVWSYLDTGDDLGDTFMDAGFDDSLWLSGPGDLGYGDGDEATALPTPSDPKPLTVYFRRTLEIPDASQVQTLAIDLVRDDGAAVYINGTEVLRDNLAADAAFDTPATNTVNGDSETRVRPFLKIDPTLLQDGENTIAVEIHQASDTSSDLSFDLQVRASLVKSLGVATINVIGVPSADTDNDGIDDAWETANGLVVGIDDSAEDLDGDGATNIEEFHALTDPQDPLSLLKVTSVSQALNGDLMVEFASVAGRTYRLQRSGDLAAAFADVAGAELVANGATSSFSISGFAADDAGFFRVQVLHP